MAGNPYEGLTNSEVSHPGGTRLTLEDDQPFKTPKGLMVTCSDHHFALRYAVARSGRMVAMHEIGMPWRRQHLACNPRGVGLPD